MSAQVRIVVCGVFKLDLGLPWKLGSGGANQTRLHFIYKETLLIYITISTITSVRPYSVRRRPVRLTFEFPIPAGV